MHCTQHDVGGFLVLVYKSTKARKEEAMKRRTKAARSGRAGREIAVEAHAIVSPMTDD